MASPFLVFEVRGGRDIEDALLKLADEFGRKGLLPLRRALRGAVEPALDDLRRTTPVDTGALRDSSHVSVVIDRRSKSTAIGRVGWGGRRAAVRIRRGQMRAVEFGRHVGAGRFVGGRRVLRSLLDRHGDEMVRTFGELVAREIDEFAAKRARSSLQGLRRGGETIRRRPRP